MPHNMYGAPHQNYVALGNVVYTADGDGLILDVLDEHVDRLIAQRCLDETAWLKLQTAHPIPSSVLSVAGRVGDVTLSNSDISGLGSAALSHATDFDAAGAAAAVTAGLGTAASADTADFDAAGAAASALASAEIYADAGDAPTIDVPISTTDATANVVAATYTPAHNTLVHVEATFLARFHTGGDGKTRKVTAVFLTDNSGTVSIVGSALGGDTHTTAGATTATADVKTDGAVVQLVVTGINATNIDWRVIGDVTLGP